MFCADVSEMGDGPASYPSIPFPRNENDRLRILRQSSILDTVADETYDTITRLCSRAFKVPICLISLIDVNRQWFKSRVGMKTAETARGLAFCTYAILEDMERVFIVENTLEDPRFKDNPLVLGEPNVRFYAGASIIVEGVKIGTICVMDNLQRKTPSATQLSNLIDFADMVGDLITQRMQGNQDMRSNGVHMHQSVLFILQEPLRHLKFEFESTQRYARQIQGNSNGGSSANSGKSIDGSSISTTSARKLFEYERKVDCFRKGVEHLEKLLENALRVTIRLQIETEASSEAPCTTFLPFDPLAWQESMGYLLVYLGLPRWLCDCRIVNDLTLESHPDLLLLSASAVLTHLAAASSWSIRVVTVYYSDEDRTLIADIICGGVGLGGDVAIEESAASNSLISVHKMLSWVGGTIQVVPGLGLHRIQLPCRPQQGSSNHGSSHHHHLPRNIIRSPLALLDGNRRSQDYTDKEHSHIRDSPGTSNPTSPTSRLHLERELGSANEGVTTSDGNQANSNNTHGNTNNNDNDDGTAAVIASLQPKSATVVVRASVTFVAAAIRSFWRSFTSIMRTSVPKVDPINAPVSADDRHEEPSDLAV